MSFQDFIIDQIKFWWKPVLLALAIVLFMVVLVALSFVGGGQ